MGEVSIIGVDLAKNVFQVHGAAADGSVVFRKKLSRLQFARFMADHPACEVAMEACPSAHHWARELSAHGHSVRLIAPHYVKPFVKRQKNDAADAEAIVEAALRPTMRFVEPKTQEQQARAVAFRTREQLVKQRTEAVNALRSHLYEFGHVAPEGIGYLPRLERVVEDPDANIPDLARDICRMLLEQIAHLTDRIKALKAKITALSNEAEMPRRLQTMPGVGPITALAVETFARVVDALLGVERDQSPEEVEEGRALAWGDRLEFAFVGIGGVEGDPEEDEARVVVAVASLGPTDPADRAVDTQTHGFGKAGADGALLFLEG
ncbi:IS110 family RNA-guided transposase [Pontitalea aquivivens]|uniref:IS110 family transposase n=1 Tax=Pontitalea aquivivens TaxID=3388663 RepID=UPI0039710461